MKKQDIKIIHEMLQQGKSSTEISLVLGIPSSTIRAHIRRHPEVYGGKPCRNCGQVMVQPIGRKVKYFCSDKCRILTQQGFTWHKSAITRVLKNYTYTGNLLLQTKYRENHLTKRTLVNHGQLPQYHATDTHEPIIDIDTYNAVQLEMHRRAQKYGKQQTSGKYPFSGMITCAGCGKHYRRKVTATGPVWICSTYNTLGKSACPSKAIPESTLLEIAAQVSTTGEITAVTAHNDNTLEFTLADGTVTVKRWQDRSRATSWTPEMRAAAGEKTRERNMKYA